jgi:flap endonuclease-1
MGVPFKDIVVRKPISLDDLKGKTVAIDTYNMLYQFLSAIRQYDGTPLKDSKGNITSHLNGLFYRTLRLLQAGVRPCFVFDGDAPELKSETQEARIKVKVAAREKYEDALASGDHETAKKYAQQTSHLTSDMVKEAKELISAMGLPWVQALGDAEAQAAHMASKGRVWAVISQDYDSLLFGAPRVIRNLTVSPRKKGSKIVSPELIDLATMLNQLKIDLPKLVNAAILIGTDYNEGIKGIGPKTALKIVQEGRFSEYDNKVTRRQAVQNIFLKPPITNNYTLEWKPMDLAKLREILCVRHDFSEKRFNTALGLNKTQTNKDQASLGDF